MGRFFIQRFPLNIELTNCMEQSSSCEANIHSGSQEFSRIVWNQKFHYSVHNSTLLAIILNQMNPIYILTLYHFKIHINIILRDE
jgi:hypothetical protein